MLSVNTIYFYDVLINLLNQIIGVVMSAGGEMIIANSLWPRIDPWIVPKLTSKNLKVLFVDFAVS